MNKVILIGNLTKSPELSTTTSGISVCKFSVAVRRAAKTADGVETDFLPVIVWRKQAEYCAVYLNKGSKVCVVGEIHNRSYQTTDGAKRTITEITASEVEFLSPKGMTINQPTIDELPPIEDGEELPF